MKAVVWLAAAAALSACSTAPQVAEAPPPPYEQLLEDGRQAQKAGNTQQALVLWQQAARQNPSAKEPWLRMAQMHFDAGDYGNAITEAQEAMQRDGGDAVANGLLAVSGLRVSSAALARMHADTMSNSTRGEAEALARTLREVLGAPVLVPQPPVAAASAPARTARAPRAPASAAAAQPAGGAKPVTAAASPSTAPAKAAAARDPFGALR
jgi:tetratricopeptide (TPR) repeat protein